MICIIFMALMICTTFMSCPWITFRASLKSRTSISLTPRGHLRVPVTIPAITVSLLPRQLPRSRNTLKLRLMHTTISTISSITPSRSRLSLLLGNLRLQLHLITKLTNRQCLLSQHPRPRHMLTIIRSTTHNRSLLRLLRLRLSQPMIPLPRPMLTTTRSTTALSRKLSLLELLLLAHPTIRPISSSPLLTAIRDLLRSLRRRNPRRKTRSLLPRKLAQVFLLTSPMFYPLRTRRKLEI